MSDMEFNLRVKTDSAEYSVRTSLFSLVELERQYDVTAFAFFAQPSVEYLGFLAHRAAIKAGHKPPPKLDDFLEQLVELEMIEDEDEPSAVGPTAAAA